MPDQPDETIDRVDVDLTIRPTNGASIQLRSIALGLTPAVLIELPDEDPGPGVIGFSIDATLDGDRSDLADLLELVTQALRGQETT